MTDELKPVKCGCGGEAVVEPSIITDLFMVMCSQCRVQTWFYKTEAEAVQAWNRAMSGNVQYVAVYGDLNAPKSKTVG